MSVLCLNWTQLGREQVGETVRRECDASESEENCSCQSREEEGGWSDEQKPCCLKCSTLELDFILRYQEGLGMIGKR